MEYLMKYVLLTDTLGSGGIATNVAAIARQLTSDGKLCEIWRLRPGDNRAALMSETHDLIRSLTSIFFYLLNPAREEHVLMATSLRTLTLANFANLLRFDRHSAWKIEFCAYHPKEFIGRSDLLNLAYRQMVTLLGPKNIFFCNSTTFQRHAATVGVGRLASNILPLVCALPAVSCPKARRQSSCLRLLFVGRIVDFKFPAILALVDLAARNDWVDVVIVGDGPLAPRLREYIAVHRVTRVTLVGAIPYSELRQMYIKSDLYFGMGTTLIESSVCGTPALVAIEGIGEDKTYGYFCTQEGYDVGEWCEGKPVFSLQQTIELVRSMSAEEYCSLSLQHMQFANHFSPKLVASVFLQLSDQAAYSRSLSKSLIFAAATIALVPFFWVAKVLSLWRRRY